MLETDYYAKQTSSGGPSSIIGWVVAIIMAIGSSFAAMNTMYAAVAYRSARNRNLARDRILAAQYSDVICLRIGTAVALLGALVGIVLMLPFNGMTTGTSNPVTFSEAVFSFAHDAQRGRRSQFCSR